MTERWRTPIFDSGWSPLNSMSGEDEMANLRGPMPRWAWLLVIGIVGVVLIVIGNLFGSFVTHPNAYLSWISPTLEEVGIAAITSAIIAVTIENWLLSDFGKDIFLTTIGHHLPATYRAAMKSEFIRLADYKFFCEDHVMTIKIEPVAGQSYVRIISKIERIIKNISSKTQTKAGYIHIDEWDFPEKSKVMECSVKFIETGKEYKMGAPNVLEDRSVMAETENVAIPPGKSISVSTSWEEYKYKNDDLEFFFTVPTLNPTIQIQAPEGFVVRQDFGTEEQEKKMDPHNPRTTLIGILFPLQRIRIRWWPTNQTR